MINPIVTSEWCRKYFIYSICFEKWKKVNYGKVVQGSWQQMGDTQHVTYPNLAAADCERKYFKWPVQN